MLNMIFGTTGYLMIYKSIGIYRTVSWEIEMFEIILKSIEALTLSDINYTILIILLSVFSFKLYFNVI